MALAKVWLDQTFPSSPDTRLITQNCAARVGRRERFLTVIQNLSVLTVEATENDELYHELSAQKSTFQESDKPVVSPCLF